MRVPYRSTCFLWMVTTIPLIFGKPIVNDTHKDTPSWVRMKKQAR